MFYNAPGSRARGGSEWRPMQDEDTGFCTFTPGVCLLPEPSPNAAGFKFCVTLYVHEGGPIIGRLDKAVAELLHGLLVNSTVTFTLHLDWARFSLSSPWQCFIDIYASPQAELAILRARYPCAYSSQINMC